MNRTIILLIGLLLMNYGKLNCKDLVSGFNTLPEDSLEILSTPDLFKLSTKWTTEYKRLHPEVMIKVISVSDTNLTYRLIGEGKIGFVSKEYYSGSNSQSLWKVIVGRDVVVPVINSKNPFSEEILKQGISPEALLGVFKNPDTHKWGIFLKNDQQKPVNIYMVNDESLRTELAQFLKTDPANIHAIEVKDGNEMVSSIQKDPYAIGFCKMINILDFKNQTIVENIRLLPIDRNGNGIIDYNEKIYDDFNVFSRGVWIGKYPKTLISNIYSVSSSQPVKENEVAFLKWVLTDGQQFLYNSGFSDLLLSERQTTLDKLYSTKIYPGSSSKDNTLPKAALIILASLIVAGLILDILIRFYRRKKADIQIPVSDGQGFLNEDKVLIPKGLYFDKTHTWAFMEENGIVKVGIDDFLQHVTGTITRIKMKNPGKKVKKGEQILTIVQNGKQLNLYAPVSGTIIEQNKMLDTNSSVLNSSPYEKGWIYKIEPVNWHRENQLLFMAEKQREHIKNEFTRLKDFMAKALKANTEQYAMVILQDGGELKDGILSNLGPEVWEDFQSNFIDPSKQIWFYEIV
jgi:glycine cleavage system H lipoate-binding protein/ABC-type phosphate transport system substrate-binding protein